MASSIINSDDGSVSGTTGLKTTGGDDGVLVFQSNGTETARINTDKQIVADAGTASLPALTTTGDVNTGIYFSAADTVDIATGGTAGLQVDSSQNLKFNSGYGSVATAYGCRAWVNFNGTGTLSIRGSGNVSSVSDTGTGQYDIYFSTSMPDTNYCATTGQSQHNPPDDYDFRFPLFIRVTETNYCRVICNQINNGLSLTDTAQALVAVFR